MSIPYVIVTLTRVGALRPGTQAQRTIRKNLDPRLQQQRTYSAPGLTCYDSSHPYAALVSQLSYPPMLDPKLEEAAAELAAIMKDIAGLRDTAEGDRAAAAKAVEGGQEGEGAEAGAGEEMQARIESLQNRLREIVGQGAEEEGGEGQEGEGKEAEEEEDSEAGDDDDEPPVLDTGGGLSLGTVGQGVFGV